MILSLVYVSSANGLFTTTDFSDILSTSRFNNKLKDITGILLYHEGNIMQVLEGEEEPVMKIYNKIKTDSRHHNVSKMIAGISAQRSFPDWPMAFKMLTTSEWVDYSMHLELNSSTLIFKLKNINLQIDRMVNSFIAKPNLSPQWIPAY